MADDAKAAAAAALEAKTDAGWDNFGTVATEVAPETPSPTQTVAAEPSPVEQKQEGEAEPPSTAQTPVPSSRQSDYDYLLSRYRKEGMSDEQAREVAAREALDASNKLAAAQRELEELRKAKSEPEPVKEPEKAAADIELPENIVQLQQRLDAHRQTFEESNQRADALKASARETQAEIKRTQRLLDRPGSDREAVEYDLRILTEELQEIQQAISKEAGRGNSAADSYNALAPLLKHALDVHKDVLTMRQDFAARREAEANAETEAQLNQERNSFYEVAKAVASDPAIGMPERLRAKFLRPKVSADDLGGYAVRAAMSYLVPDPRTGQIPRITDFKAFLTKTAKEFMDDIKESHEEQSAVYANQKLNDAGQGPGNKTGKATTEERRRPSAEALEELTDARWEKSHINAFV